MNSSSGNNSQRSSSSSAAAASFNNYNFDFGSGSSLSNRNASRPLKDQKNPSATAPAPSSAGYRPGFPSQPPTSSWTPNKPSWTHQPARAAAAPTRSALSNPSSMVGDIFGKSWTSSAPSSSVGIGLPKSDSNLFGDLVGSALGQGKASSNAPLKSKTSFSMGILSDSLPKTTAGKPTTTAPPNPTRPASYGSADNLGGFSSTGSQMGGAKIGTSSGAYSMKSSVAPPPSNQQKDPFGSLMDLGLKPSASASPSLNSNPPKVSSSGSGVSSGDFSFGAFQNADPPKADYFGVPHAPEFSSSQKPQASQPMSSVDPLDTLFASSVSSAPASAGEGSGGQQFSEANDWDLGTEFGGNDGGGTTTELEGLPPPPTGVTATIAKGKGMDNYKQGQFADAIKWLSWASILIEKAGDKSAITEVLSCRASCYKEVGEYKKAVADCSKVLEHDEKNVAVLVQRALLYESTEKYKLGAEDLRTVLKLDPTNRVARTTIHRLTQLAG